MQIAGKNDSGVIDVYTSVLRLEFDAYRSDIESNGTSTSPELQQAYEQHRAKFEQLRQILDIKLKFLDENKVSVHFKCQSSVPSLKHESTREAVCLQFHIRRYNAISR